MAAANSSSSTKGGWAFLIGLQVLLAIAAAYLYAALNNTLENNDKWLSTKANLAMGVMGSQSYVSDKNTLANEQLSLGRWHGFQEVLYRNPLSLESIEFDLLLDGKAYIVFLFNKTDAGFSGLRISRHDEFDNIFFDANADGEFISTQPMKPFKRGLSHWVPVRVEFGTGEVIALVDQQEVGRYEVEVASPQIVGFRGSRRTARIDNIRMLCGDGTLVVENFFNLRGFISAFLVVFLVLLLVNVLAQRFVGQRSGKPRWGVFAALAGTISLLVCVAIFIVAYNVWLSKAYTRGDEGHEHNYRELMVLEKNEEIRENHSETPEEGTTRVLMIGTSQTWGSGAAKVDETFVRVTEQQLNARSSKARFECINAGVNSLRAPWLLRVYKEEWSKYSPHVVVIILSNNDTPSDGGVAFKEALHGFVEECEKSASKLLFVMEANSIEVTPKELELHEKMREVAAEHGVPVVEAHEHLKAQTARGLIWWDQVHPTSFGHRLIAELLVPEIEKLARAREIAE